MSVIRGLPWNPPSSGSASSTPPQTSGTAFRNLFQRALNGTSPASQAASSSSASVPDLTDIRERVETQRNALRTSLNQLFQEEGFDTAEPILLELDEFGAFRVSNDHPNKLAIEEVLNSRPELASAFQNLSEDATLLKSLQSQKKPAVALPGQQEWLQDRGAQRFQLTFQQGNADISFV